MIGLDVRAMLASSLPVLVLVAALFAAAARRLESRVRLLVAARAAQALLLVLLAGRFGSPALALAAVARLVCGLLAARALLPAGRHARELELGPGKLILLVGAGAFGAIGYAGTGEIARALGSGGDAFRAAAGTALIGMFTAVARPRAQAQLLGLLVLSDGVALAVVTATRGEPSFAALTMALDAGLLLAAWTIVARPPVAPTAVAHVTRAAVGEAAP